jgi:RNA polymerase sigma-32 factor
MQGATYSLNVQINEDSDSGEWQDWLVNEGCDQESGLAESEESECRKSALGLAPQW